VVIERSRDGEAPSPQKNHLSTPNQLLPNNQFFSVVSSQVIEWWSFSLSK